MSDLTLVQRALHHYADALSRMAEDIDRIDHDAAEVLRAEAKLCHRVRTKAGEPVTSHGGMPAEPVSLGLLGGS